jgi:CDGSH-type Zn-finger protein
MAAAPNVLRPQVDGPNVITGEIVLVTARGARVMDTVVLCRCGHSADKPFCDGAHVRMRFCDPACLPKGPATAAAGGGTLTITPLPNGPNRCDGPLVVQDIQGGEWSATTALLCRCGESARKPFCDGTHRRNSFVG